LAELWHLWRIWQGSDGRKLGRRFEKSEAIVSLAGLLNPTFETGFTRNQAYVRDFAHAPGGIIGHISSDIFHLSFETKLCFLLRCKRASASKKWQMKNIK
jgi:hypothetical protein